MWKKLMKLNNQLKLNKLLLLITCGKTIKKVLRYHGKHNINLLKSCE